MSNENELENLESESVFLTSEEMAMIESGNRDEESRKLSTNIYDLNIALLEKNIEIARLKKTIYLERIGQERSSYKQFVEELKEKYNIENNFSFDPDTGEIK